MRARLCMGMVVAGALWIAAPARGAEVAGLYEAEVPVASRAPADQDDAVARALRQVLVKVSGRRAPETSPVIGEALASAGRFVEQFRYRSVAAEPGAAGEGEPAAELRLWARFDARVVDALVRDAGLPLWGRERPRVLVWLALERDGRRELLGADDRSGLVAVLRAVAARRGLPLTLPLLDLEDRAALAVMDVWGGFVDKVASASARYQADAIVLGRIYPQPPALWEGRWTMLTGERREQWDGEGELPEAVAEEGIEALADRLAVRFAGLSTPAGAQAVAVVVEGVDSLEAYARVVGYLEGLEEVERVVVKAVSGSRLELDVIAGGGAESLAQVIALGRVLAEEPGRVAGLHLRVVP